jgi:hypothetical protein
MKTASAALTLRGSPLFCGGAFAHVHFRAVDRRRK